MDQSLSPAAQAVLDAFVSSWDADPFEIDIKALATALRAAADQVLPEEPEPQWWEPVRPHFNRQRIRRRFLAIAAELESFAE
jgi:anti-sigma factor RsiW